MITLSPPTPAPGPAPPDGVEAPQPYWALATRDRWFFGALALATVTLLVLFAPYLYVLLVAAVLVVVTWPVYEQILSRLPGRRALATGLMMLLLVVGVVVPVGILVLVFVRQALGLVQTASQWVGAGGPGAIVAGLQNDLHVLGQRLGFEVDLATTLGGPLQEAALGVLQRTSANLPQLIGATMGLGLDSVIFLFATASLYLQGPKLVQVVHNLVPLDDRYQDKVFSAFGRLANNMVLGSLATSVLQGVIAGIGFAIAGVHPLVFLSVLAAVGSFIPLVGTALVWVPVALYVLAVDGWQWALFIVLWSVLFTTSVDNFVKPMFLRGNSQIHPLLIFLGVFSGLAWMGVPGVLVGPVVVVFFVAMYSSYVEDFLDAPR